MHVCIIIKTQGGKIMKSKHQKILEYIKSLPIGSKISVRQVAKELKVSEGTAYKLSLH